MPVIGVAACRGGRWRRCSVNEVRCRRRSRMRRKNKGVKRLPLLFFWYMAGCCCAWSSSPMGPSVKTSAAPGETRLSKPSSRSSVQCREIERERITRWPALVSGVLLCRVCGPVGAHNTPLCSYPRRSALAAEELEDARTMLELNRGDI
jgi:hypothetical protein